jgi:Mn2+/Fe2+ NRAMP family transporter
MKADAWLSFTLYTTATVAFYLLGAAVLHAKGLAVEDRRMLETLSQMYRETFGQRGLLLFLVGAFAVLYSTVFGATASNARLFADALALFRLVRCDTPQERARLVRVGCVLLPAASTTVFLLAGTPVSLVLVGALAQAFMLPFLGAMALYLRFRSTAEPLRPGRAWTACLWLSALSLAAAGAYQVAEQVGRALRAAAP